MKKTKYRTTEELVAAARAGTIPKGAVLVLDNDRVKMSEQDFSEEWEWRTIYEGDPDSLLRDLLTLLKIPWEEV